MKCVIITSYCESPVNECVPIAPGDFVICADAAYISALSCGIKPDMIIGDFDSGKAPEFSAGTEIIRVPSEKDDTDTLLCVKKAINLGYTELLIVGGIGGRLDHTVANLQTLAYAEKAGVRAVLLDGRNEARITSESITVKAKPGAYLSVFSYGGDCEVSLRDVKYPLNHKILTPDFPLGVSNAVTGETAKIDIFSGRALIIISAENRK